MPHSHLGAVLLLVFAPCATSDNGHYVTQAGPPHASVTLRPIYRCCVATW
jgi:hypothetical protein